jgi:hypothetical protein
MRGKPSRRGRRALQREAVAPRGDWQASSVKKAPKEKRIGLEGGNQEPSKREMTGFEAKAASDLD